MNLIIKKNDNLSVFEVYENGIQTAQYPFCQGVRTHEVAHSIVALGYAQTMRALPAKYV